MHWVNKLLSQQTLIYSNTRRTRDLYMKITDKYSAKVATNNNDVLLEDRMSIRQ